MKKNFFFYQALFLLLSFNLVAQDNTEGLAGKAEDAESKWYIRFFGNYGMSIGGASNPGYFNYNNAYISTTTPAISNYNYSYNKRAFGMGFRTGTGVGYILNDYINLGLDVEAYLPNTFTSTYTSNSTSATDTYIGNSTSTYKTFLLNAIPNITVKGITNPNYYFYIRVGLVVGILKTFNTEYSSHTIDRPNTGAPTTDDVIENYKYSGGIPIGYNGALGFQFKLTKAFRYFIELQNFYVSYGPKKSELTKYTEQNGTTFKDYMANYTTSQIQTTYSRNYSTSGTQNPFEPSKGTMTYYIYHSVGLGMGFTLRF